MLTLAITSVILIQHTKEQPVDPEALYPIVAVVLTAVALVISCLILAHMVGAGLEADQQARPPQ